jgi:hypothetical protein
MNPVELLQKVKALVFEGQIPAEKPMGDMPKAEDKKKEFGGYTLKDGTEVYIDKLEVGGVVTIEQETMSPAPTGEHELADGTIIVVGEGGVISEIKPAPAPEMAPEAAPVEAAVLPAQNFDEKFAAYDAKFFAAYDAKFSALEEENTNLKAAFAKADEAIKGLFDLVEKLVKEPTTEPSEPVKNGFKFGKQIDNKEEKLQSLINLFK